MTAKKTPAALASSVGFFRQFRWWRVKCWLCKKFCGDKFFNRDASLEIDRLVIEIEILRAEGTKCRPTI